jgi:O-antigen ligase
VPTEFVVGSPSYLNYLVSFYARLSHPFIGLSNDFASALNCFVLALFAWGFIDSQRSYQLLAALTVMAMTFTLSRGVLIPLVFTGIVFFLAPQLRRMLPWLAGLLGFMALGIFAYYTLVPEVGSTLAGRTSDSNVETRLLKVRVAADKIMERPLLGYGGGVVADSDAELQGGAHNVVVDMMLYFGVLPGLIVCLSLGSLPLAFLGWRSADPKVRFMARAVGFTLVSQMLIFMSETSFDAAVLRVYFYFFIGTSVALLTVMEDRNQMRAANC